MNPAAAQILDLAAQLAGEPVEVVLIRSANVSMRIVGEVSTATHGKGGHVGNGHALNGHAGKNGHAIDSAACPAGLNAIETAVYRAATVQPQSLKTLARKAGYSHGRAKEAVARLTTQEPPLLMRTAQGIRRLPEGRP